MENEFILGSIDTPSDPRDYRFEDLTMSTDSELPNEYCLDWSVYQILNQGNIGSCKAHALSMIKTYIDGNIFDDRYSVGWIYGNRYDTDWQGTGLISRETLKHLVNDGLCTNNDFPINEEYPSIVNTINSYGKDNLMSKANNHKSLAYIRLSKDDIKSYLYNYKKPILIDVYVYDNFYEANTNGGNIPKIPTGNKRGGHSMICIGYSNNTLKIVNSWGFNRGDNGFFYLDLDSTIIKELWSLEDTLNLNRPVNKDAWEKYITPNGTKWKYKKDGKYVTNDWLNIGNDWFRFNEYGIALQNEWFKDSNGYWFYFDENCYMKTGWLLDKGNYYYLSPIHDGCYGHMVTDTVVDGKYKIDSNGCWDWKTIN